MKTSEMENDHKMLFPLSFSNYQDVRPYIRAQNLMIQKKGTEIKCLQFSGHNSTSLMGQNVTYPQVLMQHFQRSLTNPKALP